jgi:hypothetical protein
MKIMLFCLVLIMVSCENDPSGPDQNSSGSYLTISGDLNESYSALAYFDTGSYTSGDTIKQYFTIMIMPRIAGANPLGMTLLFKLNPAPPAVQNYQIGEYSFGSDIPENEFGGSFSGRNATDFSGYTMTSGNINITAATTAAVTGDLEMSGYYRKLFEQDTTRIVNISGYFSATAATY